MHAIVKFHPFLALIAPMNSDLRLMLTPLFLKPRPSVNVENYSKQNNNYKKL